jgi:transcriptional regulator of acetoin/glycerol metabolism
MKRGYMPDTEETTQVKSLGEVRKEHVERVLRSTCGDLDLAGRILGISRAVLRRRIKQYGIVLEKEIPAEKE